jgi:RNA polymerase sigma-70 factor (ECF subfamily)
MQAMSVRERDPVRRATGAEETKRREAAMLVAARDDLRCFVPLYDAYFPRIYAYCLRRVGTAHEAEDLTSLIFTHALNGLPDYRGGSVAAWLFRIARNTVASHYRDHRVTVPLDTMGDDLAAEHETLADGLAHTDDIRRARELVAALSDEERELLDMHFNAALTSPEIAAITGQKPGAVRVKLHRIFKRLRVHFDEDQP